MPKLNVDALLFCVAWAVLALAAGFLGGWQAGALIAVGLLLILMPTSSLVLSRTDSFAAERTLRWGLLAATAVGFFMYYSSQVR